MKKFCLVVFMFIFASCTQVQPPTFVGSVQILKSSTSKKLRQHYLKSQSVSYYVQFIENEEAIKKIDELDTVRYYYVRKAEALNAADRYEESQKHLDAAELALRQIVEIIKNEARKPRQNKGEKQAETQNPASQNVF